MRRHDERGLTATELAVAIVVIGIIAVPITVALTQSVTFLPSAGARSSVAVNDSLLVNQLSDDFANSTDAPLVRNASIPCAAGTKIAFYTKHSTYTSSAGSNRFMRYTAVLSAASTTLMQIAVTRSVMPDTNDASTPIGTSTTMLTAYCSTTGPAIFTMTNDSGGPFQEWRVTVRLMAAASEAVTNIDIAGTLGCSAAGCGVTPPADST